MRFLVRVITWVLAALGIKALYDRFAPQAKKLSRPASEVIDTAKVATVEVTDHARAAASEVGEHAKSAAGQVIAEARTKVGEVASSTDEVGDPAPPVPGF